MIMRLWSLHPKYLDRQGLLALWREGLLAQKVIQGKTKGYKSHPQLKRFQQQNDPLAAIGSYLMAVQQESVSRGYRFDRGKIARVKKIPPIKVARGQVEYERLHLLKKLAIRDHLRYIRQAKLRRLAVHPLFRTTAGPVEDWERLK